MTESILNIIIIGDSNVEIGVHVTLFSLLEKSSFERHVIYYITDQYNKEATKRLHLSLEKFSGRYILKVIEQENGSFVEYQGLHGNTFTYSKLFLADLVDVDTAVYVDIDVVVNIDFCEFTPYLKELSAFAIAANVERKVDTALERKLLLANHKNPDSDYYNAGVMLLNLKYWRENNLKNRFLEFADTFKNRLQCADQTVINGVLDNKEVLSLPEQFNVRLENHYRKGFYDNVEGILHFYGRPKPWDFLSEYIHPHYNHFKQIRSKTYFRNYSSIRDVNKKSFMKFLRTIKSYIRVIFKIKV